MSVTITLNFQESTRNSVDLLPDPQEELVNGIGKKLGIFPVGWIFTDLVAKDLQAGTVKHFRGNIVSKRMAEQYSQTLEYKYNGR